MPYIHGLRGPATTRAPSAAKSMAEAIPGARYIVIDGASHAAPVEKPDVIYAALRELLAQVPSARETRVRNDGRREELGDEAGQ